MTPTDWQVIRAMLHDARRSLESVSKEVGVSSRTVERRLTLISKGRAVYLQGTPVFGRHAGLSCVFLVYCPDSKRKREVDEVVLSKVKRVDLANTSSEHYSTFVMVYDNLAEADAALEWIEGLDNVGSVRMGIMKELIVTQGWLKQEIDRLISS
jgi:DNA-binding Lrp family transcriptional regulator